MRKPKSTTNIIMLDHLNENEIITPSPLIDRKISFTIIKMKRFSNVNSNQKHKKNTQFSYAENGISS